MEPFEPEQAPSMLSEWEAEQARILAKVSRELPKYWLEPTDDAYEMRLPTWHCERCGKDFQFPLAHGC